MHLGAYFDPGMEFGSFFSDLSRYKKETIEAEFDRPFKGTGVKIIKSHVFANQIETLKSYWPECPIVLVHRPDDACLGWWVKCGHFNITYPLYKQYYKDLSTMAKIIKQQNEGIVDAMDTMKAHKVYNNTRLAMILGLQQPPEEYKQNYVDSDIDVRVIL